MVPSGELRPSATRATRRVITMVLATALALLGMPFLPFGVAPASAAVTPVANPPWPNTCGIDVAIVIDRSNSIRNASSQYPTDMKNAAIGIVNALAGTPSRIGVWSFGSTVYNQTNPINGTAGNATKFPYRTYTSVSGGSGVADLTATINSIPFLQSNSNMLPLYDTNSDGGTNWEDGFEVIDAPANASKTVILYLTDGNPTLPDAPPGTPVQGSTTSPADLDKGITQANIWRTNGVKVVGVGIGGGSGTPINIANIISISGPVEDDDYFDTNFTELQDKLVEIATRLCSPSVTITKQVEQPDGTYVNADGWQFQAEAATASPTPTSYTWIQPTGTPGSPVTSTTHTDGFFNGSTIFQWEPDQNVNSTGTFTEQPTPAQAAQYAFDSVACKRTNPQNPNGVNFTPNGGQTFDMTVGPQDIITCTVKNKLRRGSINIPKVTSTGAALPGAVFGLWTNSGATGSPAATCITDGSGICSFTNLLVGNYWVKEISAPVGYVPSSTIIPVTVVADQTTTTAQVVNESPGITVTKDANPTSLPEPGGTSAFTVSIHNDSPAGDSVTITTLNDNIYGNLDGQGTCDVPQTIPSGGTYTCTFNGNVSGAPGSSHTDVVTASGTDTYNNPVSDSDDATVTITGLPSSIQVLKSANPTSLPEPGGNATFNVSVQNTSAVDTVTISSLSDDVYGNLDGQGTCDVTPPIVLAPGATYNCSFTGAVSGNAGSTHTDTVTASGTDDDGDPVSDDDDATVSINDVPSSITVTKDANPTTVPEPGGNSTFSVSVHNDSSVDTITISSLSDDVYGNLDGQGTCDVNPAIVLAPGATYNCSFTGAVSGNAGSTHVDTVTATGTDDDGQPVADSDDATVTITDVPSSINVTKDANPTSLPEPGGNATFNVSVQNTSAVDTVTISSLTDDVYGNLDGQGTCDVTPPIVLAPGATYSCAFTGAVSGTPGSTHTDTVTATGTDDDGQPVADSDDATVTITDVPSSINVTKDANPTSLPEPGGNATFNVSVQNTSAADTVTISSLTDDVYGNLDGQGTCDVTPAIVLAPGATYNCSFTGAVSGNAGSTHTDTVTASGTDDDGDPVSDDDDATVTITDVPGGITVEKTANPTSIAEPGGNVTFSVTVTNNSSVDSVTIDSLNDDVYGVLAGDSDCQVGTVLAPSGSCTFDFVGAVTGNAGSTHTDVVTVTGTDDDGQPVTDDDDATVTITDVPGGITVEKTANPTSVAEPGGQVTFTVSVTNNSAVDSVTIDSLNDDVYGVLAGDADCQVGTVLPAGGSCSFDFTETVSGNAGSTHTDVVTVTGTDDDGQPVSDDDDATVTITDVPGGITVTKDANPTSIAEPGGNVTFSVTVTNNSSVDSVTIDSLNDDVYGALAGDADCQVGTILAPSGSCSFDFTETVSGNAGSTHTDVVTVTGTDDDGQPVTDDDDATVTITDVPGGITVTKDANPTSVAEPGGQVTFTVTVTNNSSVDSVTIDTLNDDVYGVLAGDADCQVGTILPAGGSCSFDFTETVSGNAGSTHTDVVTVTGTDDDGQPVSDDDDATVTITDVGGGITVTKDANPTSIAEPGGNVTFSVTVTNNSSVDSVTIDSLNDDVYGVLAGDADCQVGTILAPSGSCSFDFTGAVTGNAGSTHTDVVTVTGTDDDGQPVSDDDDATVEITPAPVGSLTISKVFDPLTSGVSRTFAINWSCDNGASGVENLAGGQSSTIGNLPSGTVCTVSEARPTGAPAGWMYGEPVVTGSPATITGSATATVTVTNSIVRHTGSVKVVKKVTGAPAGYSSSFAVLLSCSGDGGSYDRNIAYPAPGSTTITGIPTANQCNVTEPTLPPAPAGYQWATPTITGGPVTVSLGVVPVITVTNKLQPVAADTVRPAATFTTPATANQQLTTNPTVLDGNATDNVGVASVSAAIRNTSTGKYLQANGTWASTYVALPTTLANPGAASTTWSISQPLPDGNYSIQLVVKDTSNNQPATKPYRTFKVKVDVAPPPPPPADTTAPAATFTTPATANQQLTTNPTVLDGNATDNVGVASVSAAIRNTSTGKYLQANGTWASTYVALPTTLANPGAASTTWSISQPLPDGNYSIQLVVKDTSNNQPTKKPFRTFKVKVTVP